MAIGNRLFKLFGVVWVCLLALVFNVNQIFAHATPIEYAPAASSVLQETPDEVTIYFSERVEPSASSMVLYGPTGEKIDVGPAQVDITNPYLFTLPLELNSQPAGDEANYEQGTYTVSWQVVSIDDGHFTKGAFNFSIGEQTAGALATSQFEIQHNSSLVEGTLTSIELFSYSVLLGFALLQLLLLSPSFFKSISTNAQVRKVYVQRSLLVLFVAGFFGVVGYIGYIYFKTLELQSFQQISLTAAFMMFNQTVAGAYTWYKMAALVTALFGLCFFHWLAFTKKVSVKSLRGATILALVLLLLVGYLRSQVSHAAASSFLPDFSVFMNFLQLLAKGTWVGSLIVFGVIYLPVIFRLTGEKNNSQHIAKQSDKVLGIVLSICIALTGISGMYIIWLHLKNPQNIFGTAWGELFVILSAGMALMITLRVLNQLLLPWLATRWRWLHSVSAVSWTVEQASGLLLLAATGFIIITTPPLHATQYKQFSSADSKSPDLTMAIHPYDESQVLLTFADTDVENAVATVTNQELRIGPLVVEAQKRFPGGFVFAQDELSPEGMWQVAITGQRRNQYDVTAQFDVDTKTDFSPIATDGLSQHELWFTAFFAAGAAGALFFGVALVVLVLYLSKSKHTHSGIAELLLDFELKQKRTWLRKYLLSFIAVAIFSALLVVFYATYVYGLRSGFRRTCETNGHMWNQSVPLVHGQATRPVAVAGCSLGAGAGQFHFASEQEYEYFMRPFNGTAQLEVTNAIAGESSELAFEVAEVIDGQPFPLNDILVDHDRLIHVLIIHEQFNEFHHVHPEDQGITRQDIESGAFSFNHAFQQSGRYIVAMDIKVRGQYFSEQFVVEIAEANGTEETQAQPTTQEFAALFESNPQQTTQQIGPYQIELQKPAQIKSGEIVPISYVYQKNGQELTELNPYLGAPMHVALVRDDLRHFLHAHGVLPSTWFDYLTQGNTIPTDPENLKGHVHRVIPEYFGPQIDTYLFFPVPGTYHLFSEVADGDDILVSHFILEVH